MANSLDTEIFDIIALEEKRQLTSIELIASENFVSGDVLAAQGSILTNKYAEGYPNARYYGGCEFVDKVETLAIERAKKLFNCNYVNVQPHSGSQANMAVYAALISPGDTILGMGLNDGGHLTHGYNLSFSGQFYNSISYGVNEKTGLIDYEKLEILATTHKPKAIICGASSYSRLIDYKRFREIADKVNAYLIVDMAHIAGMVAAGLIPSPIPYAHVVTSTTHKTLRGPRGGLILSNDLDLGKKIDKSVFPGIQGGPLMHVIAAKAICFFEALKPSFIEYQKQVLLNARTIEQEFKKLGYEIVSGQTENHFLLVNVKKTIGITGKEAEVLLGKVNITLNKNTIPYDSERPLKASGIRIGTPAVTTLGMKEEDMKFIVSLIHKTLVNRDNETVLKEIKNEVLKFMSLFNLNVRSR